MMKSKLRLLGVISGAVILIAGQAARGDEIVYNNSTNDLSVRFNPGSTEVGDEIILGGTARQLTTFSFEYYAQGLAGGEQAQVKIYSNDGTNSTAGPQVPSTLLWSSGPFALPSADTTRSTLTFDLSGDNVVVPDSFTWTVQFALGFSSADVGVDLYSPPTVGNNYKDYWEHAPGGGWVLKQNGVNNMDFAAVFAAVPEPSVVSLFSIAAVGALLALRRRKS